MNILVTGGAGFIGSNFIRYMLNKYPDYKIVNLDKLTYAGNLENLRDIENNPNYNFHKGDIYDQLLVYQLIKLNKIDTIINFAAETHVDKSNINSVSFLMTNIFGTINLLELSKKTGIEKYVQISTDEVYGSIEQSSFDENSRFNPTSSYSASKAAADLLVLKYYKADNIPVIITRSSNNFGPYQYPEKLIPLMITNVLESKKIPIYGDGKNIRDWIYVEDNCEAIDFILHNGKIGEVYNIGANNEKENVWIAKKVLSLMGKNQDEMENFIEYVKDRPKHDRRYSLNTRKINELGWKPKNDFESALEKTVNWYVNNHDWWKKIKSGEHFQEWYKMFYVKERGLK
mgnify:FL=1